MRSAEKRMGRRVLHRNGETAARSTGIVDQRMTIVGQVVKLDSGSVE
jgi:hypothetical protein